jgi:peptidoglycan/LPS O-acetylase OafA/YrhL
LRYRSEIDGLRTLAIAPVVLFHAGFGVFGGGYVGVDVFFVISGYLITGIIAEEMRAGRFRISTFYERRIRRILPCFFVVLIAAAVAAAVLFLPRDFDAFAKSAVAAILFASNFKFWREAGYFDAAANTKPLLHTWSLAVEEQFYIFFPVALWCLYRWAPRRIFHVLVPVALASLALSLWTTTRAPVFNFFLAPTRIWALFTGGFVALGLFPELKARAVREILALLGLALIAVAVFAYGPDTPFPGAAALPPVLGAALILYAAEGTAVGRLLSLPPIVFIGLISYSLYMWHWPIIVFTEYARLERLSGWSSAAAVAASVLAATLSWHFIERPFRSKSASGDPLVSRRAIFGAAAVAMPLAVLLGVAGHLSHGWPGRFPPEVRALADAAKDYSPKRQQCHSTETRIVAPEKSCAFGAAVPPRYAIWGDSHAVELAYALGELAAKHDAAIIQLSSSACPPTIGYDPAKRPGCDARNRAVLGYLTASRDIGTVFLSSRYAAGTAAEQAALGAGLGRAVAALEGAGKRVVLIYPTPRPPTVIPNALARYRLSGRDPASLTIDEAAFEHDMAGALAALDGVDPGGPVIRVKPTDTLCDGTACQTYADGAALYFDDIHLSLAGARKISPMFDRFF